MKYNKLLLALIFLAVCITASGCYFFPEEEEILDPPALKSDSSKYMTSAVTRSDLINQTVYNGYVTAAAEYDVSFENASGKLEKLYISPGQSVKKGQIIAKLNTDDKQNDLKLQQLYVQKAQIAYNKAVSEKANSADIQTAKLNLEIEKTKLADYEKQINGSAVYAEGDGLVSYICDIGVGEYVESKKTIAKIIDSSKITVKYEASDVSQFKLGQEVTLRYDSKLYSGVISEIPKTVVGENAKNCVYATFSGETPSIDAIGKIGDIIVIHGQRENVITVSKQFVKTYDGKNYVYILKDGERVRQFIELGMEGSTEYEVKSGLNEGDLIVIG